MQFFPKRLSKKKPGLQDLAVLHETSNFGFGEVGIMNQSQRLVNLSCV